MMVEPSGHCPYLGLKQNQAIRFASPTPEHRCYATGQAQEIPTFEADYQARYCLSSGHVRCPLYTGSGLPSTPPLALGLATVEPAMPASGLRGWFAGLSRRDRAIYLGLLALLLFIFAVYTVAGLNLLRTNGFLGGAPPLPTAPVTAGTSPSGGVETRVPLTDTAAPATLTSTAASAPTATPVPPTPSDTAVPATLTNTPPPPPPSDTPVPPTLTDTPIPPTITTTPAELLTVTPAPEPPSATLTVEPATAEPPSTTPTVEPATAEPPSATLTAEPATVEPATAEPATAEPPAATPSPSFVAPTVAPAQSPAQTTAPPDSQQLSLTIYFADMTDGLYVSVARSAPVVDKQVALATLGELLAGPRREGLQRLIPPGVQLLGVRREGSQIVANFDRRPAWDGDDRGLYAIALSLTELSGVHEVQIQVQGANIGASGGSAPIARRALNPDNPSGLSERFDSGTRFLPLYFLGEGGLWVRVTRLVPRTSDVARATLDALLAGPGGYGDRLDSPIPAGTALSGAGLRSDGRRVVVDLSAAFLNAANPQAAVDAIVYSLTELRDQAGARLYTHVEILVEGRKLSERWGPAFDTQFTRKALNPE